MQKLLTQLNKKQRLWLIMGAGVLAAVSLLVLLAVCLTDRPEAKPQTTAHTGITFPSALEENPYEPTDFSQDENGYLTCVAGQSRLGIDVSGFQGQIDWQRVKAAGVEFVFIRVGGRGTTQGGLYTDDYAQTYYQGAKEAGLQVGAYFFSQAISPGEAREEAFFVLKQVADWELDLPVVYDWEWVDSASRTADVEGSMLTRCSEEFCRVIAQAGLSPMIYFNTTQALELLELERLAAYPFWLAQYDTGLHFPYRVDYWQYSCTGRVDGIEGDVDLNLQLLPREIS